MHHPYPYKKDQYVGEKQKQSGVVSPSVKYILIKILKWVLAKSNSIQWHIPCFQRKKVKLSESLVCVLFVHSSSEQ